MKQIDIRIADLRPMQRSPGRHVSEAIRQVCIQLGRFKEDGPPNEFRLELGNAFEDVIAAALADRLAGSDPDRYVRPGEFQLDGLSGTPDLIDVADWAILEIKLTWMSSRHAPDSDKFWHYWAQIKAYCKMAHTRTGRLIVGHLNGDWRGSGPVLNAWEDTFPQEELDDNWRMLCSVVQ